MRDALVEPAQHILKDPPERIRRCHPEADFVRDNVERDACLRLPAQERAKRIHRHRLRPLRAVGRNRLRIQLPQQQIAGPEREAVEQHGLRSVSFADTATVAVQPDWRPDDAAFEDVVRQLGEYFAGERTEFVVDRARSGTLFQQRVWAAVDALPYGTTVSYGEIARRVGAPPGRIRAVGAAIGANPLLIVRPCHRVVGTNAKGVWLAMRALAAPMLAGTGGSIVVTSSVSARLADETMGLYCVSKAALDMVIRVAAIEWAPAVRVNQRGDLHVGHGQYLSHMRRAARTHADYGDAHAIIGARPRLRCRGAGGNQKMSSLHAAIQCTAGGGRSAPAAKVAVSRGNLVS